MFNFQRACLIGCVLGSFAPSAFAQGDDDVPPVTTAPDGEYAVMRGVQGPAGMLSARVLLDVNLSADRAGEPISLAPDLYYSVTDKLQLGLLHQGPLGWQARPGLGLCLTGEQHGCPHVYDNLGFDAMYGVAFGKLHLSTHGTLFINSFDQGAVGAAFGVAGKVHLKRRLALFFDPKLEVELSKRDLFDDQLVIPLELQYQAGALTTLKLLTGLTGGLSAFGDTYEIPVGIGVVRNLSKHVDLGARFSFDNLLGHIPDGASRGDDRSLALLLNVRS
jgi:hypothetical protein